MNKIILLLLLLSVNLCFAISRTNKLKLLKSGTKFQDGDLIHTKDGIIRGIVLDSHKVFYGIPFATPPIGKLRFADPLPARPWEHIRDATSQKEQCIQECDLGHVACSLVGTSEDCLYLDVFIPRDLDINTKVEVMVFIPGGAFTQGTGSCPLYDATMFANSSIIVVNVNYRLGVLGFMATSTLSGNFGFLDQVRALQWVQDNIEEFGGDKNKVTIYGQSAGAFSVAAHLVSDLSKDLFHRAILSSTPLTIGLNDKSNDVALNFAERYSESVGCPRDNTTCHRLKTPKEVLEAQKTVVYDIDKGDKILDTFTIWSPVVDGVIINGQPLTEIQHGKSHDVPTIIGSVKDETKLFVNTIFKNRVDPLTYSQLVYLLFPLNVLDVIIQYPCSGTDVDCRPALIDMLNDYLFRCSDRYHLNKLVEFHDSPVYHYHYTLISNIGPFDPICSGHICHGRELSMIFNTYKSALNSDLPVEQIQTAKDLNNYWVNFIKTGNPSQGVVTETMPTWESCTKFKNVSLVIDHLIQTRDITSIDVKCDLFDKLSYNGYTKVILTTKKT